MDDGLTGLREMKESDHVWRLSPERNEGSQYDVISKLNVLADDKLHTRNCFWDTSKKIFEKKKF